MIYLPQMIQKCRQVRPSHVRLSASTFILCNELISAKPVLFPRLGDVTFGVIPVETLKNMCAHLWSFIHIFKYIFP